MVITAQGDLQRIHCINVQRSRAEDCGAEERSRAEDVELLNGHQILQLEDHRPYHQVEGNKQGPTSRSFS